MINYFVSLSLRANLELIRDFQYNCRDMKPFQVHFMNLDVVVVVVAVVVLVVDVVVVVVVHVIIIFVVLFLILFLVVAIKYCISIFNS